MKFFGYLCGLLFNVVAHRLLMRRSVYNALALSALLISGGAFLTPWWQTLAAAAAERFEAPAYAPALPPVTGGVLFLVLTFVFAGLSHRAQADQTSESLMDTPVISPPVTLGSSKLVCYCGSVVTLNQVDVVVTSENTELSLGGMSGTSMSGRMRKLAAELNVDGSVKKDHIGDRIYAWKQEQNSLGPFRLGTCVVSPPFASKARGIQAIVHAITLEKHQDGENRIDESAIREVVQFVLRFCAENQYRSLFIPAFGIGSGRLDAARHVHKTINPLVEELRRSVHPLTVYVGTYRLKDAVLVGAKLNSRERLT